MNLLKMRLLTGISMKRKVTKRYNMVSLRKNSIFDEVTGSTKAQHTSFVESSDKEWFTNHLSATFTANEDAALHSSPSNF